MISRDGAPQRGPDRKRRPKNSKRPEFVNVIIDPNQKIIPKLQFGKPIEDLSPLLKRSEFKKNMIISPLKEDSKTFSEAN
jgi:hypothetical protein